LFIAKKLTGNFCSSILKLGNPVGRNILALELIEAPTGRYASDGISFLKNAFDIAWICLAK
jgi:hypothetical protein